MLRTFVLIASVIFAHADSVQECTTAMTEMATACASTNLPNPPTAASIDGLCSISMSTAVPPVPSGCGYEMGKVAFKCPTTPPEGVTISPADQSIIGATKTVATCCMKHHAAYKLQALAIDSTAQEASSDCWTGTASSLAFTNATMGTALIPLAGSIAVTGMSNNAGNNGTNGANGANAANNGNGSANSTNTTAAPQTTTSDAGKASLTMAVMAGVAMLRA